MNSVKCTDLQASHTPGPWSVTQRYNVLKDEIGVSDHAVATVWTRAMRRQKDDTTDRAEPWPEGEANARLIAAAPDLLVALQALHDMYARTWDRVDGALVMMGDGVEQFEAAHAKASDAIKKAIGDV